MKGPNDYRDLVKKLRGETECYPDECEYCSAEGKCRCQRLGQACDAIEELIPPVGKWVNLMPPEFRADGESVFWMCSECRNAAVFLAEELPYEFCPNCGARMETKP